MSLIKCPGCSNLISELEANCPSCGFPLNEDLVLKIRAEEKKELERKLKFKNTYEGISSRMAYW